MSFNLETFCANLETFLNDPATPASSRVPVEGENDTSLIDALRACARMPIESTSAAEVSEEFFRKVMLAFVTYDYLGAASNWRSKYDRPKDIYEWVKWSFAYDLERHQTRLEELEEELQGAEGTEEVREIALEIAEHNSDSPYRSLQGAVKVFEARGVPHLYDYLEDYYC